MAKIEKTTLKRYVGGNPCCGIPGEWISVFLETDSDITRIGNDILVSNPVGMLSEGTVISETDNVFNTLQSMLTRHIVPEYVAPTVSVTISEGPEPGSYPPGTKLTATVRVEATQNDAGELILLKLLSNGREIARSDEAMVIETAISWELTEDIKLEASYQYADGPLKQDNFGKDWPEGRILAGEIYASADQDGAQFTLQTFTYIGSNTASPDAVDDEPTEEEIKNLENVIQDLKIADNPSYTLTMPLGHNRFIICIPKSVGDISSIIYKEAGYQEILNIMHRDEMKIHTSTVDPEYTEDCIVYHYTWLQPMVADLTLIIRFTPAN